VGNVGRELPDPVHRSFQAGDHVVEGGHQLADFVLRMLCDDAQRQILGRDPARRPGDGLHRPERPLNDQIPTGHG
jgi:hypothetical protein